ncbi:hypothetical protein NIIDMKKI_39910 [Mycobacterium kansasii]|uniref:NrtR DNA-binding winged helix domain-containing protein n=1 Tax=Mycobacterium kansasii TaxID=1768 RepID=A0A7G1IG87_MYCKA|nr:hypothetical protein NIIDMKKI_39910 [Mycobacterium kansasii]
MVAHARARLVAKMSYTNIGFALAPKEFALSTLRGIYGAALGYQVDATNLQRVLARRKVITQTGTVAQSGRSGGRPAALYRFTDSRLRVTDEFAALRPPAKPESSGRTASASATSPGRRVAKIAVSPDLNAQLTDCDERHAASLSLQRPTMP